MKEKARIMVVDDRPMIRECLVSALSGQPSFSVIGVGMDSNAVAEELASNSTHVVLIDACASSSNTLSLIEFIVRGFPETKVIVAVKEAGPEVLKYVEEGARGYVLSDASLDDLIMNIQMMLRGEALCSPRIAFGAFARLAELALKICDKALYKVSPITTRKMEVLQLLDEGLSNKEIAQKTCLSLYTVKNHVHAMLKELGLRNRFELVQYALHNGLVQAKSPQALEQDN